MNDNKENLVNQSRTIRPPSTTKPSFFHNAKKKDATEAIPLNKEIPVEAGVTNQSSVSKKSFVR